MSRSVKHCRAHTQNAAGPPHLPCPILQLMARLLTTMQVTQPSAGHWLLCNLSSLPHSVGEMQLARSQRSPRIARPSS